MEMAGRKVLVTGGTGFVGSHLVEQLVATGAQVRVLGNYKSQPNLGNLAFLSDDVRQRIDVVWGDVCDRDSVMHVTDGIDTIFHLAALIGIPYSYIAPDAYVRTNVTGTLNILQAARARGIQRLVHTSTSEVYGSAQYVPMDETHPLVGQSPYSASKIAADKLVESFACSFELPVVTVRPFNVFGPRQSDRAIIPTIIAQCISGQKVVKIGDPSPKRDFTFVTDTVNGFIRAATTANATGRTVNIGHGESIAIGELADRICSIVGDCRWESESTRMRPTGSEVSELLCDSRLACDLLGWSPAVSLDDGLRQTIAFVQEHPHLFQPKSYRV